jgi:hypothetical protein
VRSSCRPPCRPWCRAPSPSWCRPSCRRAGRRRVPRTGRVRRGSPRFAAVRRGSPREGHPAGSTLLPPTAATLGGVAYVARGGWHTLLPPD